MAENNPKQEGNDKVLVASNVEMLELLTELLKEGKLVRVKVTGYSMIPFMWNRGEQVELSYPKDEELIPKTLVVFVYQNRFLVHRVIERNGDMLTIMGDGIYKNTEVVKKEQVVGIVRKIIYPGGRELSTGSKYWTILSRSWSFVKILSKWPLSMGSMLGNVYRYLKKSLKKRRENIV